MAEQNEPKKARPVRPYAGRRSMQDATNSDTGKEIPVLCELSGRTKDIMLAGGLLDYTREAMK